MDKEKEIFGDSIRPLFVKEFGEDQAFAIEKAAEEHDNEVHPKRGKDPFKWALLICIGYECLEKEKYREHHGINVPFTELKEWIKEVADLRSHEGDVDYLSLFCGKYSEFIRED